MTSLSGIGYFTLPYLVHAGASHVHAYEWNPDAVEALQKNLEANEVSDRCTIHRGDNREVTCPCATCAVGHTTTLAVSEWKCGLTLSSGWEGNQRLILTFISTDEWDMHINILAAITLYVLQGDELWIPLLQKKVFQQELQPQFVSGEILLQHNDDEMV